jgi:hypothetical protein
MNWYGRRVLLLLDFNKVSPFFCLKYMCATTWTQNYVLFSELIIHKCLQFLTHNHKSLSTSQYLIEPNLLNVANMLLH